MAWLGKIQNIYRHQLYILYMFSTSLEWRGLGRVPCLTFVSIPLGKATFKELVHRDYWDYSASRYFAQSNALSALVWWHMIGAGSMSPKTSYEAVKSNGSIKKRLLGRLKRHLLNFVMPRKTQTFYYSSWKDQPVMDIPFTSTKVRRQQTPVCNLGQPCFGADS